MDILELAIIAHVVDHLGETFRKPKVFHPSASVNTVVNATYKLTPLNTRLVRLVDHVTKYFIQPSFDGSRDALQSQSIII